MRIVPRRSLLTVLLLLVIVAPGIPADKHQKQAESAQFLKEVEDRCNIRAAGSAPFRLVARVEAAALESGKRAAEGKMVLTWQSPGEWRKEIAFPGYSEVRVASEGKLWMARNIAFEPLRIYELHELMDIRSQWMLRPGESATEKRGNKQKDAAMRCVDVVGDKEPKRELCADGQSLLPLRQRPLMPRYPTVLSSEYSDYSPWGAKQFPRLMRVYEDRHLALEVSVQELASIPKPDPSLLVPPAHAIKSNWCENMESPKRTDSYPPQYPEKAKANGKEGFVSIYILIGEDGLAHNPTPVRPAGPEFNFAAIAAVSRWRYRPAMCGLNLIPFETVIDVNFILRE